MHLSDARPAAHADPHSCHDSAHSHHCIDPVPSVHHHLNPCLVLHHDHPHVHLPHTDPHAPANHTASHGVHATSQVHIHHHAPKELPPPEEDDDEDDDDDDDENVPKRIGLSDMDGARYMIFGSAFILGVDSMLFPLDTIKTIIMSERSRQYQRKSLTKMIWRIGQQEGILRFWRGLLPSVSGSFPGQAMYYLAYETAQEMSSYVFGDDGSSTAAFARGFVAGASAEIAGGMFYVPADIIAQRLQIQSTKGFVHNSRLYAGPLDVAKKIMRSEGPRGFYRGYMAYVGAYAPASAVQWGAYELFKGVLFRAATLFETSRQTASPSSDPSSAVIPHKETLVNGVSGGLASACAIMANNPLEVLRIRTQLLDAGNRKDAEHLKRGYLQLGLSILREEGWSGTLASALGGVPSANLLLACAAFYRGLRIRLIVSIPSAMVAMSGYETIKAWSKD
ncbi:mitochondrial carrier domain-containing protein [Entophlyctis helioformis]|nr:mitochondrial carrier domain-containing protein [Entophlyctis helioformis]